MARQGAICNAMTVGWGGIGVMWGEPAIFFAVRPSRYTFGLCEEGSEVSLSSFPGEMARALSYCGTHSGRDGEKWTAAGLTPIKMPCGGDGFAEATLIITARKVFSVPLDAGRFFDDSLMERWYGHEPMHTFYVSLVGGIYRRK